MGKEYKPRQEIINWISQDPEEANKEMILATGKNCYTFDDVVEEMKKGSPIGKRFYNCAEACFDELNSDEPNIHELFNKLAKMVSRHNKSRESLDHRLAQIVSYHNQRRQT